jgi:glycosyltransferase involved in cell wall biosynthesis
VKPLKSDQGSKGSFRPRVAVILATHEPDQAVAEQIQSIYAQTEVDVQIYWGDDRSTPKTRSYIRKLLSEGNFLEIPNTRKGASGNFLHLLSFPKEQYIAFADQDDIWTPNKLINHIKQLETSVEIPSLSHSNSVLKYNHKTVLKKRICGDHSFHRLSWQNCVQGCTIVINSKAQELLNRLPQENVAHHDWWIAQVVSISGVIHFIPEYDTFYRIHSGNTIGYPNSFDRIINSARRTPGVISRQTLEILNHVNDATFSSDFDLKSFQDYWNHILFGGLGARLLIAATDKRARHSRIEDLWRRIMLVYKAP